MGKPIRALVVRGRFNQIKRGRMPAAPKKRKSSDVALRPNSFHPTTRAAWRRWLQAHHTQPDGVWLISYRKPTSKPRVEYAAAVEEALCFGWIDSTARLLDEARSMQWFSPRKEGSGWSRINRTRVEQLIAAGRMAPAGLAKVEAAKQSGDWNSLDAFEALERPPDLAAALDATESARSNYEAFPHSAKFIILHWIASARAPATRAKRIAETASLAPQNIRAHQYRPKPR
jgi:uncharacterized protein YdeI (YjbR/CyaY-like superfamily)